MRSCGAQRGVSFGRLSALLGFWVSVGTGPACSANYPALVEVKQPAPEVTCLVHGRVLVGEQLTPQEDAALCFSAQQVTYVGPTNEAPAQAKTKVFDVSGATVLPGLVDTHVHVSATDAPPWRFRSPDPEHNLQAWLWHGITTVYDMGGDPEALVELATAVDSGEIAGPRLFFGHEPITAVDGHPIPAIKALLPWPLDSLLAAQVPTLTTPNDADALVQRMKDRGAQYIKVIHDSLPPGAPRLDRPRLEALVAAAHRRNLKVMVHVGSNQDGLDAVNAGADHLAHGVYNQAIDDELVRLLGERRVTVTYTSAGFNNTREMAAGNYEPASWIRQTTDPELYDAVKGPVGKQFSELDVLGEFARSIVPVEVLRQNIAKLHAAGVVILPGTDSPIAGVFPGGSYIEELDLLHSSGIPAHTLLKHATVTAAGLVGAPGRQPFGVLAVGARADVLVVQGDPSNDLSALLKVAHVFSAGKQVTRLVP